MPRRLGCLVAGLVLLAACSSAASSSDSSRTTSGAPKFRNEASRECYEKLSQGGTIDSCQQGATTAVTVPDLVGKAACDALPIIVKARLEPAATIAAQVTWTVTAQSPKAGTQTVAGHTVTLELTEPSKPLSHPSANCLAATRLSSPDEG